VYAYRPQVSGALLNCPNNPLRMWTPYASVRCDFSSTQIGNGEGNLFMFSWCQPIWSDEPSVEASMALIRGLTSFPIISMIMLLKMIEITVISTCRIIAL
jgi:hypothetical protein